MNSNMKFIRWPTLLISLMLLSACSTPVHKDFLQNFTESQKTNGSRPRVVTALAYNEKEKYLLVGHESGSVEIWDAKKARTVQEIKAHEYRANLLAFSSDGHSFFSNSYFENNTKLWNVQSGELLHLIPETRGPVSATSDKRFYIIANSAELRIFDADNKTLLAEKYRFSEQGITAIAYDVATDQVAIGTGYESIQILRFSIVNGKPTLERVSRSKPYPYGHWVIGLQFSQDGHSLYSVTRFGSIDEWSTQPLEIKRSLLTTLKNVHSTVFIPHKHLLVLSGKSIDGIGYVEFLSLNTGRLSPIKITDNYPGSIEFLPHISSVISAESYSVKAYALPSD